MPPVPDAASGSEHSDREDASGDEAKPTTVKRPRNRGRCREERGHDDGDDDIEDTTTNNTVDTRK